MNWDLRVGKSARKNLARFPKHDRLRITDALRETSINPYGGDIEKITGEARMWRRRVGDYRILYEIDTARKIISVLDIRRRTTGTYR